MSNTTGDLAEGTLGSSYYEITEKLGSWVSALPYKDGRSFTDAAKIVIKNGIFPGKSSAYTFFRNATIGNFPVYLSNKSYRKEANRTRVVNVVASLVENNEELCKFFEPLIEIMPNFVIASSLEHRLTLKV